MPNINTWLSIDAGFNFSCALLKGNIARCWGAGYNGQLGNGSNNGQLSPVDVVNVVNIKKLSVGGETACVVLADATVRCWGMNAHGQLGNGSKTNSNLAVAPLKI